MRYWTTDDGLQDDMTTSWNAEILKAEVRNHEKERREIQRNAGVPLWLEGTNRRNLPSRF